MTPSTQFQWQCHPTSETLLLKIVEKYCNANPFIAQLQEDLLAMTSTRLFDWIDHIILDYSEALVYDLEQDGYVSEHVTAHYRVFHHPGAQLPRVVIYERKPANLGLAISVDSISDFLMVRGITAPIEGDLLSRYRRCIVSTENAVSLLVIERRGGHTMEPVYTPPGYTDSYLKGSEIWRTRPRSVEDEDAAMAQALFLASQLIDLVGQDLAAWIVLEVERDYWQRKNTAGQLQKNRQDRLGMGWANHDHHTFRSSRRQFASLIRLFEMLGFYCRERFYAGKEAGWGAQVMEHRNSRLVLFLDVDLLPHEVEVDYRQRGLPELKELHTVGLWCALHGDSILSAGMHHLEAQFMFDELKKDLEISGIKMMDPFSNFPFLRQAFTKGEMWKVDPRRLDRLVVAKLISQEHAEKFRSQGALGSHMENLQRREGYKGFNQQNVSTIIQRTDPRNINY
jgi:hypothetical protein